MTFQPDDLERLDQLLTQATAVVPMRDVLDGARDPRIIGMRHDVDNDIGPAIDMAFWEAERGYRSTYFILHTAPYWQDKPMLRDALAAIDFCGHEIGIHNNALAEHSRTGEDPVVILSDAIEELREMGHQIRGTVAHGDQDCYRGGKVAFVNDQLFAECVREQYDPYPNPVPLRSFELDYDANWIPRVAYLSDSGGQWCKPGLAEITERFPFNGQLHMLVHPDWWDDAFDLVAA